MVGGLYVCERVYIHISALLLVESRRDASDGLEASAGYHLAVYMSGSPSPSAGRSKSSERARGQIARRGRQKVQGRHVCFWLAAALLCCIVTTNNMAI